MKEKMKFNTNDYQGNYVMHCDTAEKAKIFCNYLESVGRKWYSGLSYAEKTFWDTHEEDTCYYFNAGSFSEYKYYKDSNYTILEFDDFEWGNSVPKLETGRVVELRIGYRYLVVGDRLVNQNDYFYLDSFDENLMSRYGIRENDIMKIYAGKYGTINFNRLYKDENLSLIWKRKEQEKQADKKLFHGQTLEHWHRELWNWLADHPDKGKINWLETQNFTEEEKAKLRNSNYCFACISANDNCLSCPICEHKDGEVCLNGLFNKWAHSSGYERATTAHEIANLEWKTKN